MARYASTVATAAVLALSAVLSMAHAQPVQGTVIIQSGTPERMYPPAYTAYQVIPAPPPLRHEAQPRPRRGHVWVQGHWEWRGQRHAWVPGQWIQARPGQHYRQPQWDQRDGRWMMQRGGWDHDGRGRSGNGNGNGNGWNREGSGRDRDGDGVPNRYDSRPDNPRRN
ncbi:MAG: YXWGXW repeat-containing protein [Simplicispira sp.]|nr:YXWGXW repeat-containing protein [Simplicispira sp.]